MSKYLVVEAEWLEKTFPSWPHMIKPEGVVRPLTAAEMRAGDELVRAQKSHDDAVNFMTMLVLAQGGAISVPRETVIKYDIGRYGLEVEQHIDGDYYEIRAVKLTTPEQGQGQEAHNE